jgi:zinc transport system permease protein
MVINSGLISSLVVGVIVGAASAYVGSLMVLKRLGLVGDALSHVALPGIGIALAWHINPFIGAFTALSIGILLIWQIGRKTTVPTESIVGLIFTVALAIGILVTPEPDLLEALFGNIASVSSGDAILAVVLCGAIFALMSLIRRKLLLGLLSRDFAKAQGINVDAIDFIFLALVAVVVALGVKVVGTLLMGALVVIPAVASKNISRSFNSYSIISMLFGIVSAVGGILLSANFNLPPGPMVVLMSASVFLVTLIFRRTQ